MRKIGSLNLQIGLISIPLGVNSFLDYQGISFKQLCPNCDVPVSYHRVCPKCNQEIEYHQLKNGFEISKDNIVVVDKTVFKTLESYPTTILGIIPTNSEFEFITEKCYMLTPQKEAVKQYFLLLKILTVENKSLVIEFVMRKKIHLGIIKPIVLNGMSFLLLKEILYSDKIKPIEPLKEEQITEEELKLGRELIELVSQKVENKKYEEIRDKRIEILQKILSGEVKPQEIKTDETQALVEQLKKSVETSKSSQVKKPVRRKVRTNG